MKQNIGEGPGASVLDVVNEGVGSLHSDLTDERKYADHNHSATESQLPYFAISPNGRVRQKSKWTWGRFFRLSAIRVENGVP